VVGCYLDTLLGSFHYRCPIQAAGKENEQLVRGVDRHGQQRPTKVEPCDRGDRGESNMLSISLGAIW
jgi:hypothetical protein